jgi:hypothetical protein
VQKLGQIAVAVAMFSIIGGHWAVLQTVAWTAMIIEGSRTSSLAVAVSETFRGDKPCSLCHAVQEGRKQEQNLPATIQADKKIDKFLARSPATVPPPAPTHFRYPLVPRETLPSRTPEPPVPVPRFA